MTTRYDDELINKKVQKEGSERVGTLGFMFLLIAVCRSTHRLDAFFVKMGSKQWRVAVATFQLPMLSSSCQIPIPYEIPASQLDELGRGLRVDRYPTSWWATKIGG